MTEMPHLNTVGNAFFNGTQWAVVKPRHWNDGISDWMVDAAAIVATIAALIGLMLFFARS